MRLCFLSLFTLLLPIQQGECFGIGSSVIAEYHKTKIERSRKSDETKAFSNDKKERNATDSISETNKFSTVQTTLQISSPLPAQLTRVTTPSIRSHKRDNPDFFIYPNDLEVQSLKPAENSSLTLLCEPIIGKENRKAVWKKNGKTIGGVTSTSNLIYGKIQLNSEETTRSFETLPEVGFLVMPRLNTEDNGLYWCESETGIVGKATALQVAFITDKFIRTPQLTIAASGDTVILRCAPPHGVPKPRISWTKEDFELSQEQQIYSMGRVRQLATGSLEIVNFHPSDSGRYTCIARNTAGVRRKSGYVLALSRLEGRHSGKTVQCSTQTIVSIWSYILWYIAGLMSTTALMLLYVLLIALFRPNKPDAIRPIGLLRPYRGRRRDNIYI